MGKPSIFSSDYGQRMRRRRKKRIVNTILFVLIIISAAYYGGVYYKDNFGFDFGRFSINNASDKKDASKDNTPSQNSAETANNPSNDSSKVPENMTAYYEYKSPDGKIYKIEYSESAGVREITGINKESGEIFFNISTDKKKIVFCNSAGDVIVGDESGVFKKVNSDFYKSKSAGVTILKQNVMKNYPQYIWAAKPQFTLDNKVVFLSYLPYIKGASSLYIWVTDGTTMRMVGKLSNDINKVTYEGYSDDKALRIKSDGILYYLKTGAYGLTK